MHPVPVKSPLQHLEIDFIGPIVHKPPSGNCYILTVSDYLTKWVEVFATTDKSVFEICYCLFKLFMTMGIPRPITTKYGSEFNNKLNSELMQKSKISSNKYSG